VRPACWRCRKAWGGPKAGASSTHSKRFAQEWGVLLGKDEREQIENRSERVSAYAAEKLGILKPVKLDPPHSDLTRKETLLDKCAPPPNATRAYQPRAGAENICPPRTTARAIPEPPGRDPQRRGGPAGLVAPRLSPADPKRAADVAARRDQGSVG
jgi:hypothetical protein